MQLPECHLTRKGLQWSRAGHPWVYRDDLAFASGDHGDLVRVLVDGRCLGSAFLSTRSKIALRWVERGEEPRLPDDALWKERIEAALARRATLSSRTDAYRVVHDAADGIPGLIVDRYGSLAVVQTTIAGTEKLLPFLARELPLILGVEDVLARNDLAVREKEGLEREVRTLHGVCPERLWLHEEGPRGRVEFAVAPQVGQKTGAFLDQRENRWCAAEYARGRFLDAFSYSGLFALHAAPRASEVLVVDSSEPALELCEEAAARNGSENIKCVRQNVFDYLKEAVANGEIFDTVVLDPPAFAKSRRDVPAAIRGYREINRRAMTLLSPGGILITCSCSYNLSARDFLDVLRRAAADSRADFRVLEQRGSASDHPSLLSYPESGYLKCFVLEKVE